MDEISGKGKSMFMMTAIGTAVIIDETISKKSIDHVEKFENVGFERIQILRRKKQIISQAEAGSLTFYDENWTFIVENRMIEFLELILRKLSSQITSDVGDISDKFYNRTLSFMSVLPEDKISRILYESIVKEDNEQVAIKLCKLVKDLQLLDVDRVNEILQLGDLQKQKCGLKILTYDKPFYNKNDLDKFKSLSEVIRVSFPERGNRVMKKQLLSSKEKEVWICECKTTNEIGKPCSHCYRDIYGFGQKEITPDAAIRFINEKISLIEEQLY